MQTLDTKNLQAMIDQKLISTQKHPAMELYIYNYTKECQLTGLWNNETMLCRGLIMNNVGEIIARPFRKFFNADTHVHVTKKTLPIEDFEIFEKMDGSLGILYWNEEDTPCIATRGSFTSIQALKGTEMIQEYIQRYGKDDFLKDYTYVFEIIYPQNRIVVDYGTKEALVLLAIIHTKTGEEVPYRSLQTQFTGKLEVVKRYDGITDYREFIKEEDLTREGYVIRFQEENIRVKVKFAEYKRLHRLVTEVNAKTIWELLMHESDMESLLDRVPVEFSGWVIKTRTDLQTKFEKIENEATAYYFTITAALSIAGIQKTEVRAYKKAFVALAQEQPERYRAILYAMCDKRDYREMIWKMIRPFAEKPFANAG